MDVKCQSPDMILHTQILIESRPSFLGLTSDLTTLQILEEYLSLLSTEDHHRKVILSFIRSDARYDTAYRFEGPG